MKRLIFAMFAVFLLGLIAINALDSELDINSVTPTPASGVPGDTVGIVVSVTNSGASAIATVNVESSDLTFGSNIIDAPAPAVITDLAAGQTKTATLSLTLPTVLAGGYVGTISVTDLTDGSNPKTMNYAITINSVNGVDVLTYTDTNALVITGREDSVVTGTFKVKNIGTTPITFSDSSYDISALDLDDGDKAITLSFSESVETINPGEESVVTVTADIENKINIDTYGGILTVKHGSAEDTFKLEIKVRPEVCKDGPVGDELTIDINDPDNGDDFAPGDLIGIDVTVDNDGDNRIDVIVEAFLYNVNEDNEIERVESDSIRISDGDSDDFELEIEIPFDGDISEDDEYILYVKAYEDGDEDKQCVEDEVDINIERETHDVRIERIVVTPSSAMPGDFVEVTVNFINVGSKSEDDVTVRLNVPEFGWDETSSPVDLDDGEGKDNDGVARFTGLKVPLAVEKGTYSVLATVTFDDGGEESDEFAQLIILESGDGGEPVSDEDSLRVQSVSDNGDNTFSVSTVVANPGSNAKTYDLGVTASWAELIASQTFTVSGGDTKIVQFLVVAKEDTATGSYSGTIALKEAGTVVDTDTFTVAVSGKTDTGVTGATVFGDGLFGGTTGTVLFIIADIVLIIIAIFFIRLIFKSSNSKRRPKTAEKVKL